ncbi:MAG: hypothetical protein K9K67_15065 [Bacteriovoracaceae bacterium]|nr:hypothetical protein [Bacteriovoracaceae bacterium]
MYKIFIFTFISFSIWGSFCPKTKPILGPINLIGSEKLTIQPYCLNDQLEFRFNSDNEKEHISKNQLGCSCINEHYSESWVAKTFKIDVNRIGILVTLMGGGEGVFVHHFLFIKTDNEFKLLWNELWSGHEQVSIENAKLEVIDSNKNFKEEVLFTTTWSITDNESWLTSEDIVDDIYKKIHIEFNANKEIMEPVANSVTFVLKVAEGSRSVLAKQKIALIRNKSCKKENLLLIDASENKGISKKDYALVHFEESLLKIELLKKHYEKCPILQASPELLKISL